jgi:uncharacterized coiled-coil DUF342 family protein
MQGEVRGVTAELYEAIVAIVDHRVAEIKVTRQDFDELKSVVKELAEAQKETGQRVNELAEAQKETGQRVNELAEAQKETDKSLQELALAQARTENELRYLARQVGVISDTLGFGLEDIAKVVLPGYLERHLSVRVDKLK